MDIVTSFKEFFYTFWVYNLNGITYVVYFLKTNIMFLIVLLAMGYIIFEDMKIHTETYVDDERRML